MKIYVYEYNTKSYIERITSFKNKKSMVEALIQTIFNY